MRTRLIVGLVIVALAVTASVMLTAAPRGRGAAAAPPPGVARGGAGAMGGPGCPWGMGMGLGRLAKALELTDAQIADLKKLQEDFLTATKATREELQAKAKEMIELWAPDQPDAGAIKALAGEIDVLRVEIRNAGIDHMISALGVLTAAQREKLRTIVKEWAPKCIGGMGCGFGFGPGLCCGMGMGPGGPAGPGLGPRGMGGGMGPGWGNGTGPRSRTGTCPLLNK